MKVRVAAKQNVWLSSEKCLPRDWLPAHNDPAYLGPWSSALEQLSLLLLARSHPLDTAIATPGEARACLLGGLGWHAVKLHDAMFQLQLQQEALAASSPPELTSSAYGLRGFSVQSLHLDQLSLALANAMIRTNVDPGPAGLSFSAALAEAAACSSSDMDAVEQALVDQVCRRAADGWLQELRGKDQASGLGGSSAPISSSESPGGDAIGLLVCVDACSSRLSLQQLASQLWQVGALEHSVAHPAPHCPRPIYAVRMQAKPQLLPGALLCPATVRLWGVLVESPALVAMNEVGGVVAGRRVRRQ